RQLHGSLLNMRRVVSRICGALFRVSLVWGTVVLIFEPDDIVWLQVATGLNFEQFWRNVVRILQAARETLRAAQRP
ncbi:hypothetical protein QYZ31_02780, partial [Xanthomonas campestris pv. campestris]